MKDLFNQPITWGTALTGFCIVLGACIISVGILTVRDYLKNKK